MAWALWYVFYFMAKALKSVETQSEVSFTDCIGDFMLLIFLPIGIWFIQPRINKIFAAEPEPETINIPEGYL